MSGPRRYPDEPAGPFPRPPVAFEDREGRSIEVRVLEPNDERGYEALVDLYVTFDPAERAQGIPPVGERRIRDWLDVVLADGPDVVAWHGDRAVGHATLVPDDREHHDAANGAEWNGQPASMDADQAAESAGSRAGPVDRSDHDTVPHELAIFVLQAYQRAGIGRSLLTALLGHAAARNIDRVWLTVERWNRSAAALYESVGFEVCGTERFEQEMAILLDAE